MAKEHLKIFTWVGLPKEILMDKGTNFRFSVLKGLFEMLKIKQLRTSVYHPQRDELVEQFNRPLKDMLKKFIMDEQWKWSQLIPPLIFAVCEAPPASLGFSPFELLYER